jgi:hypothetical protein
MGRPERSVDIKSGPVARFACELRALRQAAGAPGYRTMAARANYSATVLSRAASGNELPSLPVALAYVTACGGDPVEWEALWREVVGQLPHGTGTRLAGDAGNRIPAAGITEGSLTGVSRSRAVMVKSVIRNVAEARYWALASILAMAAVSGWATALAGFAGHDGSHTAARSTAGNVAVGIRSAAAIPPADLSDGNDPTESGCAPGAVTVAHATVRLLAATIIAGIPRTAGTAVGQVELRYSPRCHAAWARATPSPGYKVGSLGSVTVTITRRADGTYSSFRAAAITEAYGDLLLTRGGCLTAAAEFQFARGGRAAARTSCWAEP